jgi:hypothetical protein
MAEIRLCSAALIAMSATFAAGPIHADPLVAKGVIASIDASKRCFTLEAGQTFIAGAKVKLSSRRIGEEVIVGYRVHPDHLLAVSVRRVPVALKAPIITPSPN